MENAKKELLRLLKSKARVQCAKISNGDAFDENKKNIILKIGYSESEWEEFLTLLNFNYDSGFGGQNLYGIIWLEDGTWCSRGEYDGSEWWEHNKLPEVPKELI